MRTFTEDEATKGGVVCLDLTVGAIARQPYSAGETHLQCMGCLGSKCVAWDWLDPSHEVGRNDAWQIIVSESDRPPGDGWEWKAKEQRWMRPDPVRRGTCRRNHPESHVAEIRTDG